MSLFKMAKTAIKNIFRKPFTVKYPFGPRREFYKNTRGRIVVDINKCIFCGLCQRKCPTNSIVVAQEDKAWKIDRLRCIACGYCVEVCPAHCLAMERRYSEPSRQNKGEDIVAKV